MYALTPIAIQTTYQDLLERHRTRPSVSIAGSIIKKVKSDNSYWIARRRVGAQPIDTQIGPNNSDVRERIRQAITEQAREKEWRHGTGQLVAQLRASGSPTFDMQSGKVISSLGRAGFFKAGGILAGTHAFALYELELGVRFSASMARTEDIDLVADRHVSVVAPNGGKILPLLDDLVLEPIGGVLDHHPTRWKSEGGIPIDFLTSRRRGGKEIVELEGLGIYAQALPFMEYIIQDPIEAVGLYREGILLRIPAPERYAIHKLIVAAARTGSFRSKSAKDMAQAEALIEVLAEQRPFELSAAYQEATSRGQKWNSLIKQSLKRLPQTEILLDEL